jgi:hypothetical protein
VKGLLIVKSMSWRRELLIRCVDILFWVSNGLSDGLVIGGFQNVQERNGSSELR